MTIKELKKLPSLVLLNSEGDILTAYKEGESFHILDEYKKVIDVLSKENFINFINGDLILTNSEGEKFDYPTFSEGMRRKFDVLNEFMYGY
jgi:hypothetical protein